MQYLLAALLPVRWPLRRQRHGRRRKTTIAVFTKNLTNPAYEAFRIAADQIARAAGARIAALRSEAARQCRRTEGDGGAGPEGPAGRRRLHSRRRRRHDRFGEEAQRSQNPGRAGVQSAARQFRHLCRRRRFRDRIPRGALSVREARRQGQRSSSSRAPGGADQPRARARLQARASPNFPASKCSAPASATTSSPTPGA